MLENSRALVPSDPMNLSKPIPRSRLRIFHSKKGQIRYIMKVVLSTNQAYPQNDMHVRWLSL